MCRTPAGKTVWLKPRLYSVTFAPRARRCLVIAVLIRPVPPTTSAFNMLASIGPCARYDHGFGCTIKAIDGGPTLV
jgi:hypothetical protein